MLDFIKCLSSVQENDSSWNVNVEIFTYEFHNAKHLMLDRVHSSKIAQKQVCYFALHIRWIVKQIISLRREFLKNNF